MTYHDYGTESALSFSYCSLGENCFYLFHATIIRVIIFHYVFLQISRSHLSRNKAGYPRFYLYVLHPHDRDYGGQNITYRPHLTPFLTNKYSAIESINGDIFYPIYLLY